jgi:hypothetical protein
MSSLANSLTLIKFLVAVRLLGGIALFAAAAHEGLKCEIPRNSKTLGCGYGGQYAPAHAATHNQRGHREAGLDSS